MSDEPLRVLVIDDQSWTRRLIVAALSHDGRFDVLEAASATAGLAMIRDYAPEVVLLDYVLPDMDGGAVLDELRSSRDRPPIVIVTTTVAHDRQEAELLERGAAAVFPKPVDLRSLPDQIAARAGTPAVGNDASP